MVKHKWTDEACHTLSSSWSHRSPKLSSSDIWDNCFYLCVFRQDSDAAPEPCMLCDVLDDSLRGVRGHIDSVRDRENEVGLDLPDFPDNDEPDVNNSTHTSQVCSNWYVVDKSRFLSSSGPGPGQVRVRWWSGRSESGKVQLRELKTQGFGPEPYNKFGFHPPPTHPPPQTFFLAFKGSRQVRWT